MHPLYRRDREFMQQQMLRTVAGIDEAGRGALAGPVVIAAVVLDYDKPIKGLNDSKLLRPAFRECLYQEIMETAVDTCVIEIESAVIDQMNIREASILGFARAFKGLESYPDHALIDGKDAPAQLYHMATAVIKGDMIHACIAAASILAKVHRDHLMEHLDRVYPAYGFATHKGYGTVKHYAALALHGACKEHRKSFRLY
jgi:ribonuclease HII